MTERAICVCVPTISFHLGTKERGGGDREKNAEGDGGDSGCLFIRNIFSEGNGAEEVPPTHSPLPLYCRDDGFIGSIKKKRICNRDGCLIAIEKLKAF